MEQNAFEKLVGTQVFKKFSVLVEPEVHYLEEMALQTTGETYIMGNF
jgi:hypothetical protein